MAITLHDLVPLETYRRGRNDYLHKMIAYKKNRRIRIADHVSLLFENRNTVLFQIQELANSEDLTDAKELNEYIEIYSGMLPSQNELSATLFIELDNQKLLEEILKRLKGIEHHLSLLVGNETIRAVFEEEHDDREVTTSVHYLKFPLTETAKEYLLQQSVDSSDIRIALDHPHLAAEVRLDPDTVKSLQNDFSK